jgi:hypothetical protein
MYLRLIVAPAAAPAAADSVLLMLSGLYVSIYEFVAPTSLCA